MSLGSMFSSPGKQASAAASASGQIADSEINKLLNYTDTHQQQLRDAIAKQGPNPYFGAAQQLDPQAYYVNPQDAVTFGAGGPGSGSGLTHGALSTSNGQPTAPDIPRVILTPQTSVGPTPTPNPTPIGGQNPFQPRPTPPPGQGGPGYQGPPHGGLLPIIPPRRPQ